MGRQFSSNRKVERVRHAVCTQQLVAIVCVLTAIFQSGCEPGVTRRVEAVVLAKEGEVSWKIGSEAESSVQPDSRIGGGATLRTTGDARVGLALLPGALIQLEPVSELRLQSLQLVKIAYRLEDAIRREVHLELARGTLVTSIAFESSSDDLSIATPEGTLTLASHALCRIEVRDRVTRVTCARGVVSFKTRDDAAAVTLQAPESREWPSQAADRIPADFDVRAMEEIENVKEVEQKLLGLEERRRLSPFPWRQ